MSEEDRQRLRKCKKNQILGMSQKELQQQKKYQKSTFFS